MKYFNYKQFDLNKLSDLKKKSGVTVGLALPVYNEEKTIRKIILTAQKCKGVIDEVIVVDSGSSDNSKKICKELGTTVINDKLAAKELGIKYVKGKGWNLWSSLYYLNTDIIIWIDTDIQNINIGFITGLLGPMIMDKKIKFVKGYYHRRSGYPRATEIIARPFINLVFPKAKDFIQPLSGEYGGRREFLEKVLFYSGYGVESAVLIQAIHELRRNEVAQSYLGERIHESHDILFLGRMSANILNTLFDIADKMGYIKLMKKKSSIFKQYIYEENKFSAIDIKLDKHLPPMLNINKYVKKFKRQNK